MSTDPVTEQIVLAAYEAWLVEAGEPRSGLAGALFAMRMTLVGTKKFQGLNEHDLCLLVGGDVYATG